VAWTPATATAAFLKAQNPTATAYVIDESALATALDEAGIRLSRYSPDYVVLGQAHQYSLNTITRAVRLT
jgi:NagD protein